MELVCFILILFPFSFVYAENDTAVLIAFKGKLSDPRGVLSDWKQPDHCSWEGIHCDPDNNNVTTIDLGDKLLEGSLAPALGNLSKLEYLRVYGNQLSGSIPAELGKLTNLLSLNLGNNSLTGPIPPELGNLTKLTWLLLNDNNLSGGVPFPDPLTNLFHNITYWNLSGNPSLCGNLTNPYNACTT